MFASSAGVTTIETMNETEFDGFLKRLPLLFPSFIFSVEHSKYRAANVLFGKCVCFIILDVDKVFKAVLNGKLKKKKKSWQSTKIPSAKKIWQNIRCARYNHATRPTRQSFH